MAGIRFGTDGWRAVMAEDFTFANVRRVAQATADHFAACPPPGARRRVVVGFDTRFLSDAFARAAAEVFCGNGFETILTPAPSPTPALSLAVRDFRAAAGVVITASHNPPEFNGFKIKAHFGGSAEPALCQAVEACLDRHPVRAIPLPDAVRSGRARILDLLPAHLRAVKDLVDFNLIARSRLRLAHDALFGVGAGCFERLLGRTSCRVTTLNGTRDVLFGGINPEPIPANYGLASAWLREHPQDVCVVTDGDADRVGAMDGRGRPVSTHQVICLLLRHLVLHRGGRGAVVKALTTTSMLDRMCAEHGLTLIETPVGFRHIGAEMRRGPVLLGGEESGGIGFQGHIPERDGLLAGLMLLEMLAAERRPIGALTRALERRYGPHRYARLDLRFPVEKRGALMAHCLRRPPLRLLRSPVDAIKSFDGVKYVARNGSWLMLRGSGTEPVLRIYAEAESDAAARRLLAVGGRMTRAV